MTDDMVVNMPGRGWSAVGGRVQTPSTRTAPAVTGPVNRGAAPPLTGRVSFATSDGLLGPSRRLRPRHTRVLRFVAAWALVVMLMPLAAGWAWGVVG